MPDDRPEEQSVLRWSAYEHEYRERERDWYWALGIVAGSIALTSILLHDYLFSLLILLAAGALALHARMEPDLHDFALTEAGLIVNDRTIYRFEDMIAFWVEEAHYLGRPLLLIDTKKIMAPNVIVPLEDIDPQLVRAFLVERIEEREMKEPFAHRLFDFFNL
jgi:hypothetical protein